jgi:hypothetical protein
MTDVAGNEGDTVAFRVTVTGSPAPKVEFHRDGKPVLESRLLSIQQEAGNVYRLQFAQLSSAVCGKYEIVASNDLGKATASARLDLKKAPTFVHQLSDVTCTEGDDEIKITVKVDGFPVPKVQFRLKGELLDDKSDGRFEIITLQQPDCVLHTLVIKNPTLDDTGKLEVLAENSEGSDSSAANLIVKSAPRFLQTPAADTSVRNETETVELKCVCVGLPVPSLVWTVNGQRVSASSDDQTVKTEQSADGKVTSKLTLKHVKSDLKIECVASNELGEKRAQSNVRIDSRPVLLRTFTDQTVNEGDPDVEFRVALRKQEPEAQAQFALNGKVISSADARFEIRRKNTKVPVTSESSSATVAGRRGSRRSSQAAEEAATEYTLVIKEASPELAGQITFEAKNDVGTVDCNAQFVIRRKPRFTQPLPAHLDTQLHDDCTLRVQACGYPRPKLVWYRNGEELNTSSTIVIEEKGKEGDDQFVIGTCHMEEITLQLFGDFECVAVNEAGEVRTSVRLDQVSGPAFQGELPDQSAFVGEQVQFEIKVTGLPEPEITWLRDGREIGKGSEMHSELQNGTAKLVIKDLKRTHEATYQVRARNEHGRAESNTAQLHVLQPSTPRFNGMNDQRTIAGENVQFKVKIDGQPPPEVKWLRNGQPLEESDRVHIDRSPSGLCSLRIDAVTPNDAAEYSCVATNPSGSTECKAKLDVEEPCKPRITGLDDQEGNLGDRVRLEARVFAVPCAKVEWFKDGEPIDIDGQSISIEQLPGDLYALTLNALESKQVGRYTVKASNCVGEAELTADVKVRVQPPRISKHLQPLVKVDEGNDLVFSGQVKGHPPPEITWYKDGIAVQPDGKRIISQVFPDGTCVLTVRNAKPEDQGEYELRAKDAAGNTTSSSGKAEVVCKPDFLKNLDSNAQSPSGQPLKLEVVVKAFPTAALEWFKDGERVEHRLDVSPVESLPDNVQRHVITIPSVDEKSAGVYSCRATNRHGQAKSTGCAVQPALDSKPEFSKGLKDVNSVKNDSAKLQVTVGGAPRPEVQFFKDNQPIDVGGAGDRVRIEADPSTGNYSLVIDYCKPEDHGEYTCVATNAHGEVTSKGHLIITGKTLSICWTTLTPYSIQLKTCLFFQQILKRRKSMVCKIKKLAWVNQWSCRPM